MGKKSIEYSDELFYNTTRHYVDDKYNLSGLYKWEAAMIEKYFKGLKNILLIAAGGGRETVALHNMGFEVDSYECNPRLIEYGNSLLRNNGIEREIKYLPPNTLPSVIKEYDGVIVGWGAYSLMPGSKNRLTFLSQLHPFLSENAPLMISFLRAGDRSSQEIMIKNISNFFRAFSRSDKTEAGDRLIPDFIHYFTDEEIKNELETTNYSIIDFTTSDYACLIAKPDFH